MKPNDLIDLLEQMRDHLYLQDSPDRYYLCHALRRVSGVKISDEPTDPAAIHLDQYITEALSTTGSLTLDTHISRTIRQRTHHIGASSRLVRLASRVVNDCDWSFLMRLAWIDRMIYQLELDGTLP